MPANIVLRDLTNPPVKGNSYPIIATRLDLRNGVRTSGEIVMPPGGGANASFSFGDAALGGTFENGVLTITTDGTLDFGTEGPEMIALVSLESDSEYVTTANVRVGQGVTLDPTVPSMFEVVADPAMPFGRGWKIGGSDGGQNPTYSERLWVDHPPHSRIFESRVTYWPQAQRVNAAPFLDGNAIWGMKPIWNMADRHFGGDKTNFFWSSTYSWYATGQYFSLYSAISTNLPKTTYFSGSHNQNPDDPQYKPYLSPYIINTLWDQGSLTPGIKDSSVKTLSTRVGVGQVYDVGRNDLELFGPGGQADRFNSFSYPGYIRGFGLDIEAHILDGEIYKTGGPGAARAVVISDHADFKQATRYTYQWITNWSQTQIQADVRPGFFNLADRDGLYVNITDENFNQLGSRPL